MAARSLDVGLEDEERSAECEVRSACCSVRCQGRCEVRGALTPALSRERKREWRERRDCSGAGLRSAQCRAANWVNEANACRDAACCVSTVLAGGLA